MPDHANESIVVAAIATGDFIDDVWVLYDAITHAQIEARSLTPYYVLDRGDPMKSILILEALAKSLRPEFELRGHNPPSVSAWANPLGFLDETTQFLFTFLSLLPKAGETVH